MKFRIIALMMAALLAAVVVFTLRGLETPGQPPQPPVPGVEGDHGRSGNIGPVVEAQERALADDPAGDGGTVRRDGDDSRKWWLKIINDAPKNLKYPKVPAQPKAFMHLALSFRHPIKKRWSLRVSDLIKDAEVNPTHRQVAPEVQAGLGAAIAQHVASLDALEEGFNVQLEDAYHTQIENGVFVEVDSSSGDFEATRKAVAELEKTIGKELVDHFRISVSCMTPGHHAIVYVTAATAPAVFDTVREINRVQGEGRLVARQYLATH